MAATDRFDGLGVFLAAAQHRNFRRAATQLGLTPSAVSHAVRVLETRLGLPLFLRTTRSVALTDAGIVLFTRLTSANAVLDDAFAELADMRVRPHGVVRLTVPRLFCPLFVTPLLVRFHEAHPDVAVEVSVDDAHVDLAAGGFDAGIRVSDSVARDMVGIRLSPKLTWCIVGSPGYFEQHGHPKGPRDLVRHTTIGYRRAGTNAIYRWELERAKRAYSIDVGAQLTVNDGALALSLARSGVGLVYTADAYIQSDLARGTLVRTLVDYAPTSAGFFLYYVRGAQRQPKLRVFLETVRAFVAAQ